MKRISIIIIALASLLLAACTPVQLSSPLPPKLNHYDLEKFEGEWSPGPNGVIYVRLSCSGALKFVALDWKNEPFDITEGELTISEAGENKDLLNVQVNGKGKEEKSYYFMLYHFTDQGDLILWVPKSQVFKQAVQDKKLLGKEEKAIVLTDTPANILKFIATEDKYRLFEFTEPQIFKRAHINIVSDKKSRNCKP